MVAEEGSWLLATSASEAKNDVRRAPVRSENTVLGKSRNTTLPVINSRGIGYYYASYYSGVGCSGTPTYQEGYATGKCLILQLYNLGLGSFKPMCMFITPTAYGVPGKTENTRINFLFYFTNFYFCSPRFCFLPY